MTEYFKLSNEKIFISTQAPGGIYSSQQLKKIADICEDDAGIVKITENQRISLFLDEELYAQTLSSLEEVGLVVKTYNSGLEQPVNCIGELCPKFQQDALGTAIDIGEQLEDTELSQPLRIGVNGCEQSCVATHTLDISLVGESTGYKLSLGGKQTLLPEIASFVAEGIPAEKVPLLIKNIISLFAEHAKKDEILSDLIERIGLSQFTKILVPYSQDAASDNDIDFSVDDSEEILDETEEKIELDEIDLDDLEEHVEENDPADSEALKEAEDLDDKVDMLDESELDVADINVSAEMSSQSDNLDEISLVQDDLVGEPSDLSMENSIDELSESEAQVDGDVTELSESAEEADSSVEEGSELEDGSDSVIELSESELDSNVEDVAQLDNLSSDEIQSDEASLIIDERQNEELESIESDDTQLDNEDINKNAKLALVDETEVDTNQSEPESSVEDVDDFEQKLNLSIAEEEELNDEQTSDSGVEIDDLESLSNDIEDSSFESSSSSADEESQNNVIEAGWKFTGARIFNEGTLVLQFSSGATLEISTENFNVGDTKLINLGEEEIKVIPDENGIKVVFNDVSLYLPRRLVS